MHGKQKPPWPRPPRWVVVVIAVQILLPLGALVADGIPTRFGFHMYSDEFEVGYEARDASGQVIEDELLVRGSIRPEIDWVNHLPDFVCENLRDAFTVKVWQPGDTRTVTCKR